MMRQETIDRAVAWAVNTARNAAHGYDQAHRWGPDYDCSSFVIEAWRQAGVPVKEAGASYTGNMRSAFLKCDFRNVTGQVNLATGAGLQKGDVLLNDENHTEMYIGDGAVVKASINERGTVTGGQSGDQSGREIYVGSYYNFPWDCVLRYKAEDATPEPPETPEEPAEDEPKPRDFSLSFRVIRRGDKGEDVKAMQILLNGRDCSVGKWGADGDYGPATEAALKAFQRRNDLDPDGEAGPMTMTKLLGL